MPPPFVVLVDRSVAPSSLGVMEFLSDAAICLPSSLPYLNNAAISRRSEKRRNYIDFRTTDLRHEVLEFTHSDIRVDHSSPSVRFGIRTIQINGRTMTLATV